MQLRHRNESKSVTHVQIIHYQLVFHFLTAVVDVVGTRLGQEPVITSDTLKSPLLSPGFLQFPKVKFKLSVTFFCSWWRGWVFFQSKRSIHLKCNTTCIDYTIINTDIYSVTAIPNTSNSVSSNNQTTQDRPRDDFNSLFQLTCWLLDI